MLVKKWWKEIQTVGFKDWWWFVVTIKRDEFHENLRYCVLHRKYSKRFPTFTEISKMVAKERERAHEIDLKLSNL